MVKRNIVEKHITVDEPVHVKLSHVANVEKRTMRAVATRIIDEAYAKCVRNEKAKK